MQHCATSNLLQVLYCEPGIQWPPVPSCYDFSVTTDGFSVGAAVERLSPTRF